MAPELELEVKLAAIGRRLRWLTVERRVAWCLLPGLAAALGVVAAWKLDRLDDPYALLGAAVALPLAAGVLWGFLRPISRLDSAMLADERLGLKERLSSAVLVAASPTASALAPALIRDAGRHAEAISPRQVLPHRLTPAMRWSAVMAVLIGAAWLAPTYPLGRTFGQIAVKQQIRDQGRRLEQVARRAQQDAAARGLKAPAESAARLRKLAEELARAKLDKKQALLKTGALAQEMREAQKLAALAEGRQELARAAEALREVPLETAEAQDLARAVREQRADDLAARLRQLTQQLREGKPQGARERQALARDLREMAGGLAGAGMGDAAAALQEAAGKLEQGKTAEAADALEKAAQQAGQAAQAQAERESLERMAREVEQSQQQVAQADQKPGSG